MATGGARAATGEAAPSPYEVAAGHAARGRRQAMALVAAATLPAAVVVVVVLTLLVSPAVGAPAAVVLWAALGVALWRSAPGQVVRSLGAVASDPASQARLHNLTESLCVAAGLPKPALLVVPEDAPNSMTVGLSPRSACLLVTSGLLERLNRLELEAVLAHELSHLRRGDMVVSAATAVTVGPLLRVAPGPATKVAARMLRGREAAADVAAVGLTRYPPALVSALGHMRDAPVSSPRSRAGAGLLWNVAPPGVPMPPDDPDSVEVRIQSLLEL